MAENEINKVQVLIRRFLFEVDGIIHDPSACQAWLQSFCKTLQFQDLCKEPNQYALFLLDEARAFNIEQRRKSQMKQVRRALAEDGIKNPTQEQLDEKWLEMYGQENSPQDAPNGNAGVDMSDAGNGAASKSPTSCDQFTADGDIREDSQAKPDGSAITRNETRAHDALEPSANISEARQSRRTGANAPKGGRTSQSHSAPARPPLPRNKEEVRLFAIDNGLDVDDANDWAEMNLRERHGRDKDGKPIRNWKGAILNYCKAMAAKRETA